MKIHICIDLFPYTVEWSCQHAAPCHIFLSHAHIHLHTRDYASYDTEENKNREKESEEKTEEMKCWKNTRCAKDQTQNAQEIPNKLRVFTANRMSFKIKKKRAPCLRASKGARKQKKKECEEMKEKKKKTGRNAFHFIVWSLVSKLLAI